MVDRKQLVKNVIERLAKSSLVKTNDEYNMPPLMKVYVLPISNAENQQFSIVESCDGNSKDIITCNLKHLRHYH